MWVGTGGQGKGRWGGGDEFDTNSRAFENVMDYSIQNLWRLQGFSSKGRLCVPVKQK